MSIDVHAKILSGDMEHADCILCGQCVDNCTQKVIAYSFGKRIK
jgi:NAD-dependent dihydropyrimidine dehydrogenase PreA subunit